MGATELQEGGGVKTNDHKKNKIIMFGEVQLLLFAAAAAVCGIIRLLNFVLLCCCCCTGIALSVGKEAHRARSKPNNFYNYCCNEFEGEKGDPSVVGRGYGLLTCLPCEVQSFAYYIAPGYSSSISYDILQQYFCCCLL